MSISTFLGLYNARSGLTAAQRGLDLTGHNVANANTPGYSRQRANLIAAQPITYPSLTGLLPGQLGQGVEVESITRVRDTFLDAIYRDQSGGLGFFGAQEPSLRQLETVLNEPSDTGLGALMAEFWDRWNEVANTPESRPSRTALRDTTLSMIDSLHITKSQLDTLRDQQVAQIDFAAAEINGLARQVADLNRQILQVEGSGEHANDLMDRRDLLVDELSRLLNVTTQVQPHGGLDVLIGGVKLVSGIHAQQVDTRTVIDRDTQRRSVELFFVQGNIPLPVRGGELAGFMTTLSESIPEVEDQLNRLASTLVNRVNQVHLKHYGLDGASNRSFFTDIRTQSRLGANLETLFPTLSPVDQHTTLASLGITAGQFTIQGVAITLTSAEVRDDEGLTLGDLAERINAAQPTVRARIDTESGGAKFVLDLYNPEKREDEIEVAGGTSNALSVLGLVNARNFDTADRAAYDTILREIDLSLLVREDVGVVAAAGETLPGQFAGEGDNQGALLMAGLQERGDLFTTGGSFQGFLDSIATTLGDRARSNSRASSNQAALVDQADNQRQAVFGVNLDEEAVELIKFQKAYEASARVIATMDSVLDALINIL